MKKVIGGVLSLFLCMVLSSQLWAQNKTISGKVTDEKGAAISNASVMVKGTKLGVSTDGSGTFKFSVPNTAKTLLVSSTNFLSKEVEISSTPITIVLVAGETELEEVVVVGYGTQRVTKVSGSVATVKGADIEKLHPVRAEDALQGRASGVTVISAGSPGAKPTVLIRGIPSYTGTDPVVVVDGSIQTLNDLNSINSSDIESISVLKDAATTAI